MKSTFPTIEGHIVELTKFSGCYAVDIFGYSEHATRAEAIAAAKKRIAAVRAEDEEGVKMSVAFGTFERTDFFEMSEAISHVRKNRLPYVRLQSGNLSWDNF